MVIISVMTVKFDELEQFIEDIVIEIKRIKVSDLFLKERIARKWGCSTYILKSRFDALVLLKLIELDVNANAPGIYFLNNRAIRDAKKKEEERKKKEEAAEEEKRMHMIEAAAMMPKEKKK